LVGRRIAEIAGSGPYTRHVASHPLNGERRIDVGSPTHPPDTTGGGTMNGWCAIEDCTIPTESDYCEIHEPQPHEIGGSRPRHDSPMPVLT
jgi:hypothetical protein